ncbi:hypothetical protein J2X46_001092 [Nocardioides sp. BE266]|uniref:hypothetical protein n=1 Tax=Nocardioides sp. BE266 TaxID=2817725 RepID=UPI00286784D2|nr:hypothetical protein [Nocardioides sp. BE266]MDR7252116.1 hypothetical protein [Nocardioides sp. BE266]
MGAGWLPWSTASLASGAVLLVLGALSMPPTAEVGQLIESVTHQDDAWLMAAVSFFLASVGLTMGLPAFLWLFPRRHQASGLVGLWIWALGIIGMAGVAALLVLFRAVVRIVGLTAAQSEALSHDPALRIGVLCLFGAFYLGELVVALVLLRGRAVPLWVPGALVLHVVFAPLNHLLPANLQGLQTIVLGVALMGVAVRATETWAGSRPMSPL